MQDTGFRIQDSGCRIPDNGFRIPDTGCWMLGFRMQDSWIEDASKI